MPRPTLLLLRLLTILAVSLPVVAVGGETAEAAAPIFTVDARNDAVDANPGDGRCRTQAGSCTLRAAVMEADARPGHDTIRLPAGTYTLSILGVDQDAAAGDLNVTDALTLTGAGAGATTIRGNGAGCGDETGDRLFHVAESLRMHRVTLRGGCSHTEGGAIYTSSRTTLTDVAVVDNFASGAGTGIFVTRSGSLTMTGGRLTRNRTAFASFNPNEILYGGAVGNEGTATLRGVAVVNNEGGVDGTGGIANYGTMSITDTTIAGNVMRGEHAGGGGIRNGGTLTIANTRVLRNQATRPDEIGGGGMLNTGSVTATDVVFDGNFAHAGGGGIFNVGALILRRAMITDNSTKGSVIGFTDGGGLANAGRAVLREVSFLRNSVVGPDGDEPGVGGAIGHFHWSCCPASRPRAYLNAARVTMAGNSADGAGGGLGASAPFRLANVTIAKNAAPTGSGVFNQAASALARMVNLTVAGNTAQPGGASVQTATTLELSNTVVAHKPGTAGSDCAGPIRSAGGNLASDQSCQLGQPGVDPRLGSGLRRSRGSYTSTLALLPGSPAIDYGTGPGCPARDQRGVRRPIDGNGDGRKVCDAGAFEFQP